MTDEPKKISALDPYTEIAAGDYVPIVDISEAADADKTKRALLSTLNVFVPLTTPLTSTAWDGDSFSTTAKTLIDLSAVFSAPAGISAILVQAIVRDGVSAGGDYRLILGPTDADTVGVVAQAAYTTNDNWQCHLLTVPCNADGDIYYQISASGVGTFDANLLIWGYWL
jgi:hypothetical protein